MLPFSDQLPSFDPPRHTAHRALMMRLLTPGPAAGERGVHGAARRPPARRARRRRARASSSATTRRRSRCWWSPSSRACPRRTTACSPSGSAKLPEELEHKPLEFLYEQFTAYIEDRRREPRDDIMTAMATATFPDGTTPEVQRRRAARRQPVHRRPGDDRPPAVVRAADPRRAAGHPGRACAPTATSSRTSSRRRCATRARCGPSSAWPRCARRSPASTSPPAAR